MADADVGNREKQGTISDTGTVSASWGFSPFCITGNSLNNVSWMSETQTGYLHFQFSSRWRRVVLFLLTFCRRVAEQTLDYELNVYTQVSSSVVVFIKVAHWCLRWKRLANATLSKTHRLHTPLLDRAHLWKEKLLNKTPSPWNNNVQATNRVPEVTMLL